jgi:DNA (cytosine-5)-methyltransferase 1
MIKILDICSGIGGFSLGLEATGGFDTVAFCEFDDFCCKVLNKHWPNVPIYKDLKEIGNDPARIIQEFDLICGGIPCQPFSLAGKQKGKEDDRHLWPYMYAIVKSKKPTWVIVENVGGFVNVALDDVCLDLETQGYATQSFIIPACSVEAPHKRDRIWILGKLMANAHDTGDRTPGSKADEDRQETIEGWQEQSQLGSSRSSNDVANSKSSQSGEQTKLMANAHDTGDRTPGSKADEDRQETIEGWQEQSQLGSSRSSNDVADPKLVSSDSISDSGSNTKTESDGQTGGSNDGRQGSAGQGHTQSELGGMADGIPTRLDGHLGFEREPNIPRVATGIPDRVNRLKALGNSIVPQIVYNIGLAILEEEKRNERTL